MKKGLRKPSPVTSWSWLLTALGFNALHELSRLKKGICELQGWTTWERKIRLEPSLSTGSWMRMWRMSWVLWIKSSLLSARPLVILDGDIFKLDLDLSWSNETLTNYLRFDYFWLHTNVCLWQLLGLSSPRRCTRRETLLFSGVTLWRWVACRTRNSMMPPSFWQRVFNNDQHLPLLWSLFPTSFLHTCDRALSVSSRALASMLTQFLLWRFSRAGHQWLRQQVWSIYLSLTKTSLLSFNLSMTKTTIFHHFICQWQRQQALLFHVSQWQRQQVFSFHLMSMTKTTPCNVNDKANKFYYLIWFSSDAAIWGGWWRSLRPRTAVPGLSPFEQLSHPTSRRLLWISMAFWSWAMRGWMKTCGRRASFWLIGSWVARRGVWVCMLSIWLSWDTGWILSCKERSLSVYVVHLNNIMRYSRMFLCLE